MYSRLGGEQRRLRPPSWTWCLALEQNEIKRTWGILYHRAYSRIKHFFEMDSEIFWILKILVVVVNFAWWGGAAHIAAHKTPKMQSYSLGSLFSLGQKDTIKPIIEQFCLWACTAQSVFLSSIFAQPVFGKFCPCSTPFQSLSLPLKSIWPPLKSIWPQSGHLWSQSGHNLATSEVNLATCCASWILRIQKNSDSISKKCLIELIYQQYYQQSIVSVLVSVSLHTNVWARPSTMIFGSWPQEAVGGESKKRSGTDQPWGLGQAPPGGRSCVFKWNLKAETPGSSAGKQSSQGEKGDVP